MKIKNRTESIPPVIADQDTRWSQVRRHNEALGFYKEALHIKGKIGATVGNFLATYAEVATTQVGVFLVRRSARLSQRTLRPVDHVAPIFVNSTNARCLLVLCAVANRQVRRRSRYVTGCACSSRGKHVSDRTGYPEPGKSSALSELVSQTIASAAYPIRQFGESIGFAPSFVRLAATTAILRMKTAVDLFVGLFCVP